MKIFFPNVITVSRIVGALCLLIFEFSTSFSGTFWIIYLGCGISDVLDGFIARALNSQSRLGAILDSVADLCFIGCCAWKLFPIINLDKWMWGWIILILLIKIINQISALYVHGKLIFPHTIANKVTGFLLFLSIPIYARLALSTPVILTAIIATFAALQEGQYIKTIYNKTTFKLQMEQ